MEPGDQDDVKRFTRELGTIIQRALASSPQLGSCLQRIKSAGFEISMVLDATMRFHRTGRSGAASAEPVELQVERQEPPRPRMTPLDKRFLRSLKISVDDDE